MDKKKAKVRNPYARSVASNPNPTHHKTATKRANPSSQSNSTFKSTNTGAESKKPRRLQAGLLYDDDDDDHHHSRNHDHNDHLSHQGWTTIGDATIASSYIESQRSSNSNGKIKVLYHDPDFRAGPEAIEGVHTTNASFKKAVKCWCTPSQPAVLSYSKGTGKVGKLHQPFYCCGNTTVTSSSTNSSIDTSAGKSTQGRRKCRFFKWAYQPQLMHWYRFGIHNHHTLVHDKNTFQLDAYASAFSTGASQATVTTSNNFNNSLGISNGFSAQDLVQGKVGDCWFLSALAVIAERPDLIQRLFPNYGNDQVMKDQEEYGIVQVKLFMDGYWTTITMDTFLPCLMEFQGEERVGISGAWGGSSGRGTGWSTTSDSSTSPHALCNNSRQIIQDTKQFLYQDRRKKNNNDGDGGIDRRSSMQPVDPMRPINSNDLAYSKAQNQQLWVPFLEKAYAKMHGSYQAISGGHIAEAFLDLTGAPTMQYHFDHPQFHAKQFWSNLLSYRQQRLPMGCATSTTQAGLVGMHAYSILDVREIHNVSVDFFKDDLLRGTLGGVSGFTEYDGTVRLLRIRNPHGQGEWKGKFSDSSVVWEKLLQHQNIYSADSSISLERTMKNDGTFWIDYDSFLMGFSNVDVVFAFQGNHAKSFATNFPPKKSPHRCTRAFEVTMIDQQPGMGDASDSVELYIMPIQKTKRGASRGRVDRKVSYKQSDIGIFIAKYVEESENDEVIDYSDGIMGKMIGLRRVGHSRIRLTRTLRSIVVMPTSFGHPSATDKSMSFVLRFVSNEPLMIRELSTVPRMERVMHHYCLRSSQSMTHLLHQPQGQKHILFEGRGEYRVFLVDQSSSGGIVFFYIYVDNEFAKKKQRCFSLQVKCRGMVCRDENGLLQHERVSNQGTRKKFEAAWRQYRCEFNDEDMSRLLMVLVRSGQDYEFQPHHVSFHLNIERKAQNNQGIKQYLDKTGSKESQYSTTGLDDSYERRGIFAPLKNEVYDTNHYVSQRQDLHFDCNVLDIQEQFESDLARTLELSKEDGALEHTLEMSQKSGLDADMELAMKLSLEASRGKDKSTTIIDVDSDPSIQNTNPKQAQVSDVIEILDDDEEDASMSLKPMPANEIGKTTDLFIDGHSRNIAKIDMTNEVIEIVDDREDFQDSNNDESASNAQKSLDFDRKMTVEEKRQLAALAATKRIHEHY